MAMNHSNLLLRRVADEHVGQQGDEDGDHGREKIGADQKVEFRVTSVEPRAEPDGAVDGHRADQRSAHVVGAVPDRHLRAAFVDREPVGHDAAARGPAHTVEPADQKVQDRHEDDGQLFALRAEQRDRDDHEHHRHGCQDQSQRQEHAGVAAVRDASHQEFGQRIGYGVHREDDAQFALVEAEERKFGNRHRKVLPDDVESGVSDEDAEKYLQAHAFVFRIHLVGFHFRFIRRGLQ